MSTEIPALHFEEIDFEPEKEVWNTYELGDRSILRIRSILLKLLRKPKLAPKGKILAPRADQGETEDFQAKFQNLLTVVKASPTLMGKPSPPLPPEELAKKERVEVTFVPYREDWNIYSLPEGRRMKIKLVVSSVFRLKGQYDELGYPVYLVSSTNAIAPVPKP